MLTGILFPIILLALGGGIVYTIVQRRDETVDRGAAVRRLYFYLVALISYITALFGLDGILRTLADVWLGEKSLYTINDERYIREQLARTAGFLLVATLIFLLHWGYVQQRRQRPGEAGSALRKLFLYVGLGFTVGFALAIGYQLLSGIVDLAFGLPLSQSTIWPSQWLYLSAMLLACFGLIAYLNRTLHGDGDYGQESNRAAALWRRLYLLVACLVGITITLWGVTSLLSVIIESILDQLSTVLSISAGGTPSWSGPITQLILGTILLRLHWSMWQSLLTATATRTNELNSAVRRLYLYGAVVIGALFALIGSAMILDAFLLRAFGSTSDSLLDIIRGNRMALAAIGPGAIAWRLYWLQLHRESERYGESRQGVEVRRVYYYAVAATGLALLWIGAGTLVQVVLDWLMSGDLLGQGLWREPLAHGLSMLAVGAPVWSLHWQAVQPIARQNNEAGAEERSALPRRIYLYGVALIGALVILFFLAQVVYRFFLMILGDTESSFFSPQTANEIAQSLIAAALWGVHMLALRTDMRMGGPTEPDKSSDRRAELEARISRLETELAAAKEELAKIENGELGE
ncbi:MAG: DUF5671 domain-containing protein [Caldilineaceae bacterium]